MQAHENRYRDRETEDQNLGIGSIVATAATGVATYALTKDPGVSTMFTMLAGLAGGVTGAIRGRTESLTSSIVKGLGGATVGFGVAFGAVAAYNKLDEIATAHAEPVKKQIILCEEVEAMEKAYEKAKADAQRTGDPIPPLNTAGCEWARDVGVPYRPKLREAKTLDLSPIH